MMPTPDDSFIFEQIHIDAARNATDDFNLFHDKHKWHRITNNPFNGPIVLGFQLESLIEYQVRCYREAHHEDRLIRDHGLHFSNYQFSFANVIKPGEAVTVDIKKSQFRSGDNSTLGNRISVKSEGNLALTGFKKESQSALFLPEPNLPRFKNLRRALDRSMLPGSSFFVKRKFMNTSNAKNFLAGSLAEQADYFDELENKAVFPEIFPCGLISCTLLEKAMNEHHDFIANPMVYASHKISIDRRQLAQLKSNDTLHILIREIPVEASNQGLGYTSNASHLFECYGLLKNNVILYRALISLISLQKILGA